MIELNANFRDRVLIHSDNIHWQGSPVPGVHRRMLDRIGNEVARATSIVKFDRNSRFSPHTHNGGEEFLVLDGVFQDEHGDYPAGSYIRNPPQSRHTPGSALGCVLFVKLWQFDPDDRTHIRTNVNEIDCQLDSANPGSWITPLYRDQRERVQIEQWDANTRVTIDSSGGAELLVLEGEFEESGDALGVRSWLRIPDGRKTVARTGSSGARVWIKTGHLRFIKPPGV